QQVFFPAAALFGALVVPLSLAGMSTAAPWLAAYSSPAGHARELLFGFALAIITGYLLGKTSRQQLWATFGLWLAARVSWLIDPGGSWALATQAVFAIVFAASLAPKFLGSGRRWRNLAVAPLLVLLAASAVAFDLMPSRVVLVQYSILFLLAWLLAFMGGRLTMPAIAQQLERAGFELAARSQPRLEGVIVASLGGAALCALVVPGLPVAGALALVGSSVIGARLLRWRIWLCRGRPDLWCLASAHLWLVLGLALLGIALLTGWSSRGYVHAITIGALGTFAFNVMLRADLQRRQGLPARDKLIVYGTILISIAAMTRLAASWTDTIHQPLLGIAAAAWCLAYLMLGYRLLSLRRVIRQPSRLGR
ncbi:MAG: NnrS family protein, partial [Gammaproteobacteria bacterium]